MNRYIQITTFVGRSLFIVIGVLHLGITCTQAAEGCTQTTGCSVSQPPVSEFVSTRDIVNAFNWNFEPNLLDISHRKAFRYYLVSRFQAPKVALASEDVTMEEIGKFLSITNPDLQKESFRSHVIRKEVTRWTQDPNPRQSVPHRHHNLPPDGRGHYGQYPEYRKYLQIFVKQVRHLSTAESVYHSCLDGLCLSKDSTPVLTSSLDPNRHYFTLTLTADGSSKGYIAIVLGEAFVESWDVKIKVAFIEKIRGVESSEIVPMVDSVRRSLEEQGYLLALPKDLESHKVSNDPAIHDLIKNEIHTDKNMTYRSFIPYPHNYGFLVEDDSLAYQRLSVEKVLPLELPEDTQIRKGDFFPSWKIQGPFPFEKLLDSVALDEALEEAGESLSQEP